MLRSDFDPGGAVGIPEVDNQLIARDSRAGPSDRQQGAKADTNALLAIRVPTAEGQLQLLFPLGKPALAVRKELELREIDAAFPDELPVSKDRMGREAGTQVKTRRRRS